MRYFARLAYNGSAYHGWQKQKNTNKTVQQVIEEALFTLSRTEITVVGCGRTDTGVHASDYVLHFDSEYDFIDKEYKVNSILPEDVAFYHIWQVPPGSHARFDALNRTYHYDLHTRKDPFLKNLSFRYYNRRLDILKLNDIASKLIGTYDFSVFAKTGSDVTNYNCEVYRCFWQKKTEHNYSFTIQANRFLRGMVRLIVGMCLHVHDGKMDIKEIEKALENQEPISRPYSVPAHGLYLTRITYPEKINQGV